MGKKPFIFGDEMCGDEVFQGRSVPGTKCSGDKVCRGRSAPGTKCSGDEMFLGTKCSRGRSVPGDEMGVTLIYEAAIQIFFSNFNDSVSNNGDFH